MICGVFCLSVVFKLLAKYFHSDFFSLVHVSLKFLIVPLIVYAVFRENNLGDKSEDVSPRAAIIIFSGVGLMIVYILFHAVPY